MTITGRKPDSGWQQVYHLGMHELICGDSLDAYAMPGEVGCLVFDPPWDDPWDGEIPPHELWPAASILAFCDGQSLGGIVQRFGAPTWVFAWDTFAPWSTGPRRPLRSMKLCAWYGDINNYDRDAVLVGEPPTSKDHPSTSFVPLGGRRLTDCWRQSLRWLHHGAPHPHMKPLGWLRAMIGNTSSGLVFDPFAGSGQTIFACDELHRPSVSVEIDPLACDVIRARWGAWCEYRGVDPGPDALNPSLFPDLVLLPSDEGGHVASMKRLRDVSQLSLLGGAA